LAPFYPHPGESRPLWQPMLAALFWGGMAWTFWRWRNTRPWWLAGWAWYCVALLPVAGLLQVGAQSHADRYTYVPLIGVFAACIWAGHERLRSAEKPVVFGVCAALGVWVLLLTGMAFAQTAHWRDSQSLYRHALRVTKGNHLAHKNLGVALTEAADIVAARTGRPDVALLKEALTHYVAAVKMRANDPDIHYNIGNTYMSLNDNSQAADAFRRAIKLKPDHLLAHYNLANMLARAGDTETALAEYAEALRIDPNHTDALANMGNTYAMSRRFAEAEQCYRKALTIDPANCDIHINLGNVFWEQGRQQEGLEAYQSAVRTDPKRAQAHYSLGLSLRTLNRKPEALEAFSQALALDPKLDSARRAIQELK
jgi:tetratricopeptide (TPR) repeat protein